MTLNQLSKGILNCKSMRLGYGTFIFSDNKARPLLGLAVRRGLHYGNSVTQSDVGPRAKLLG